MSEFRKYTREELVKFVRSMDRVIEEPTEILVIGGAAAALKYGATASTKDIDTWHAVPRAVAKAAADARTETGLPVPIEKAGVSDGPYHYEDRIQTVVDEAEEAPNPRPGAPRPGPHEGRAGGQAR